MNRTIAILATTLAVIALSPRSGAQQPQSPHLGYAYPAGGRQGTTVEVTVGGQLLINAVSVQCDAGITAEMGEYHRPLTQGEVNKIRDKLEEARKKLEGDDGAASDAKGTAAPKKKLGVIAIIRLAKEAGVSDAELKALQEFQQIRNDPKRQLNPQIQETIKLKVTIAPNAAPGAHELRILTPLGLTNPTVFQVGQTAECVETEPNDTTPDAAIGARLPVVVNGQIFPGDVDRFRLPARKGQNLVVNVAARALIPYLADAVPGWFQAVVSLRDPHGAEVAHSDHFLFNQDPVAFYRIPEDGDYTLEIHDSVYRGREDFVYRMTVGEVPFITGIFPLGGKAGTRVPVDVRGWNLPQTRVTVDTEGRDSGTTGVTVTGAGLGSNTAPFAIDTLPECLEKEPNDQGTHAQKVTLPIIVNGHIDRPGDTDVFTFEGKAGQTVVAEVNARRLGSPVDSLLTVVDHDGRQLAMNDDWEDKGAGLLTHQADSQIVLKLPKTGRYYVVLRDAQHQGGPEYAYRLRISAPQPDFALRVVPSSISGRAGTTVPVTVYALRRDGFNGDIALTLKNQPVGFSMGGARIPGNADCVRFTLTFPLGRRDGAVPLEFEGRARIGAREVRHAAVPAEDMMQAFAYRHLVPAGACLAAVAGRLAAAPLVKLVDDKPVRIPAGGTGDVHISAPGWMSATQLRFALNDAADGLEIGGVKAQNGGFCLTIKADAKVKPGLAGNLIVDGFREAAPVAAKGKPAANARRSAPIVTLPAIPFEIVSR